MSKLSGSCMCGSVRYQLNGDLREAIGCHCVQCRKSSGHFTAATAVSPEGLTILSDQGLKWFRSSDIAQRGFCCLCGSTLFWKPEHGKHVSVFVGSIDGDTGLSISHHICTQEKGDYYTVEE